MHYFSLENWQCKINCVTHYFLLENSSVRERPAPRGGTTRPDERKIAIIYILSISIRKLLNIPSSLFLYTKIGPCLHFDTAPLRNNVTNYTSSFLFATSSKIFRAFSKTVVSSSITKPPSGPGSR